MRKHRGTAVVQELVSGREESIAKRAAPLNVKLQANVISMRFSAEQQPEHSKPTVAGQDADKFARSEFEQLCWSAG